MRSEGFNVYTTDLGEEGIDSVNLRLRIIVPICSCRHEPLEVLKSCAGQSAGRGRSFGQRHREKKLRRSAWCRRLNDQRSTGRTGRRIQAVGRRAKGPRSGHHDRQADGQSDAKTGEVDGPRVHRPQGTQSWSCSRSARVRSSKEMSSIIYYGGGRARTQDIEC